MRTIIAALLLPLGFVGSTSALADSRVRTIAYDASSVVSIGGKEAFQSSIVFADDEKIENIAVGDSLAWQVTPNKRANVLFVKSVAHNAPTNMTVVTDRRVYLFDLLPSSRSAPLLYSLRFAYAEPSASVAPAAPTPPAEPPPAAPREPESIAAEARLNFAWTMGGVPSLLPSHVFDDGRSVYLDWAKDAPMPAILVPAADGSEGPVNFTMRGDTIVIHGVVDRLVLRSGKDMATLTNESHARPRSVPPAGSVAVVAHGAER